VTHRLDRRALIHVGAALGLLPLCGRPRAADAEACHADVSEGRLRGIRQGAVDIYRGIPYAGSVAGAHRFQAAPPPLSWRGTRDATRLGPPAMQPRGGTYGIDEPAPSEDCLVLNIWAPVGGARNKPVMVYSHGGGLVTGSAGSPVQDGSNLARDNDVVVVATNHRLGVFGFLYLDQLAGGEFAGSGNRGVQDIAVALEWVHANIAAVGGDPNNVMIFGDSGGGLKTSCLYAMPQAAPFFHKASIESGLGVRVIEAETAARTTRQLLDQLGIAPADWRKLLEVPASALLDAQARMAPPPNMAPPAWPGRAGIGGGTVGTFGAVRDGGLLPHHPFDPAAPALSRDKPLLVGGNQEEHMFFSLVGRDMAAWDLNEAALLARMEKAFGARAGAVVATYRIDRAGASPSDLFFAIQSDLFSGQGSTLIAERKALQGGAPAYRYVLAYHQGAPVGNTGHTLGALHAMDIPLKFNNVNVGVGGRPSIAGPRPERLAMAQTMGRTWANFARTGTPAAPGLPRWPAYELVRRSTMVLDLASHVEEDPYPAERLFWAKEG
jgi:para-nitrobenzyl esterase